jgi:hypothetical protein
MKKYFLALLWCAVSATTAAAGYVFYNKVVGEWTVTCWRPMSGDGKPCRLSAPLELLAPLTPQNMIVVTEVADDSYQVSLEIRDAVSAWLPAFVRVDGNQAHETGVAGGVAAWSGEQAVSILREMNEGQHLVFRIYTGPEGLPRDVHVALGYSFTEAFTAYRQTLRAHKMIKAR